MWINKRLTFHISAEGEKSKHEYYISKSSVTKENAMSEITICVPVIKRVLCKIFPFFYWSIQLLLVLQLSIKHSNSCSFPHVCNSTLSSAAKFHGLKGLILGIGQDFHCFLLLRTIILHCRQTHESPSKCQRCGCWSFWLPIEASNVASACSNVASTCSNIARNQQWHKSSLTWKSCKFKPLLIYVFCIWV